jgi:hypothetical protein
LKKLDLPTFGLQITVTFPNIFDSYLLNRALLYEKLEKNKIRKKLAENLFKNSFFIFEIYFIFFRYFFILFSFFCI